MQELENGVWLCLICNKSYNQRRNLRSHILNYHQGDQSVQCTICFKTYKNKAILSSHISHSHKNSDFNSWYTNEGVCSK